MLGPALISAVLALQGESVEPMPLMSLPLEDIICVDRDLPPPPVRGKVCLEIDGVPSMECWPDLPASLPPLSFGWSVRSYTLAHAPSLLPPSMRGLLPSLAEESSAADGHVRLPEEPPRV
jgi:hypothetical protein